MLSQIFLPIAATFVCYALYHAVQLLYRDLTSPLRHVGGPKSPSLILGNFKQMTVTRMSCILLLALTIRKDDSQLTAKWRSEFGPTFMFRGLFSISELHTSDLKAINHIISNSTVYQKAISTRVSSTRLLGKGILGVELDEHRRHNPAFGISQIRVVTEVFIEKAVLLRDIWAGQVARENDVARIEVLSWLRRMTLDVIGQAGFNYDFDALETKGKPNELNAVFTELFHSSHATRYAALRLSQAIMPILRLVPFPGVQVLFAARRKMRAIGSQIVSKSKATLQASQDEKVLGRRRDLLATLLKANISANIPESQRLTDAEVIAQIPTFFFAGHETTSVATSWALHALSLHTAAQAKLREELLTISTDNPTMEELNSLPYLEMVVREVMRAHAPVVFTQRMAMEDDVLPLSKPYIDRDGNSHDSLPIPKGQMIHVPILAVNTDKEIWGEDASEFKPERWENIPDGASDIPGVWANLLTFFAGPHNCIGFRFSLVELKALLFTLIRAFEFEAAVPKGGIASVTSGLLQRPAVLAEAEKGSGLPLILRPVGRQAF
ncbi:cytochrome P450 [Mycena belliarum]|uniref:Cytochrome P450 n=1 Tax=Mycena belliarum TaxID=1033014 RepID=A0AAD6XP02_9AGAR|nr:cytochrome P450 [Mycena belliae]